MGSLLDNVMQLKGIKLSDELIANITAATIRETANTYLAATLNSVTPEVNRLCADYLNQKLVAYQALTALALKKNWIKPYLTPDNQIASAYQNAETVLAQSEGTL